MRNVKYLFPWDLLGTQTLVSGIQANLGDRVWFFLRDLNMVNSH